MLIHSMYEGCSNWRGSQETRSTWWYWKLFLASKLLRKVIMPAKRLVGFQRIARWCLNGSPHACLASVSVIRISVNHPYSHIWSASIVYYQVSRRFSINCRNSLNAWHFTVLRPSVPESETSGCPLKETLYTLLGWPIRSQTVQFGWL